MKKFTDPQYLTQEQYKDSSNLDARIVLHQKFSVNSQGWHNWVFDQLLQLPANANILELGCGNAALWKESSQRIPAGWNITLSDFSDGMLDAAWKNLVVTGRAFKFEKIDAQSIPHTDGTFDAVIANHMLYHISNRKKALSEIKRVLKDDGMLIATTVGENHMQEINTWMKKAQKTEYEKPSSPFTLENGKTQLTEFFPRVELLHYEDHLRVTEISALMTYLRSMNGEAISEDEIQKIEAELSAALAKYGSIFITKNSGLFKAFK